ncbi:UNVERIFIED_CONTAM: hypothetical protein GTU68_004528 [Idotea baltica]|nr:hypothetical protein [Idotea baltica]
MLGLGLIAGVIGKFLTPGRDPGGCIITIIIGIAGSFLGGYIASLMGWGGITGGFDFRSIGLSVLGVVVLLLLSRLIFGKKKK